MTNHPSMPEAEAAYLKSCYEDAGVILEYGSGGSTEMAAQLPGKLVMSIESDRHWARTLRQKINAANPTSQVIIQHVDVGETGSWGRMVDDSHWQSYHRYPTAVWDAPFFRHPNVILIDGRFRTACLMTAILRITRPVKVLFDDYVDRPKYQLVEQLVRPHSIVGRMAEFHLQPSSLKSEDISFVIAQFFQATFAGKGQADYSLKVDQSKALRHIPKSAEKGKN